MGAQTEESLSVLEGYWESSYRSGRVPWDPGPYDRHLPDVLHSHSPPPGLALDIGCGEGKSAIWLARRGWDVLGIDVAPTAIHRARSLRAEGERRTGTPLPGQCRLEVARFPDDLPRLAPGVGGFAFIMERGLLHHMRSRRDHEPFLRAISEWLAPSGLFYALLAKSEGAHRFGGPPTWSHDEVERALSAHMEIVELRGSVFTPGEAGSIPAWVVVAKGK